MLKLNIYVNIYIYLKIYIIILEIFKSMLMIVMLNK